MPRVCFLCKAPDPSFKFPANESDLLKWISILNIQRPNKVSSSGPRLCASHFKEEDIVNQSNGKW